MEANALPTHRTGAFAFFLTRHPDSPVVGQALQIEPDGMRGWLAVNYRATGYGIIVELLGCHPCWEQPRRADLVAIIRQGSCTIADARLAQAR